MKYFKSIREGNSVEPGVSEIDDVPEDPLSYVEIKPKKTKVVKEGIVDTAANAKVRIFSSIDRKKKELYKNAVKEDIQEAITVKKEKYSWGKMVTVHHGSDTSYPLHPEHQQAIAKLGDGEKTSFKDETNSSVHAEREGDTVHLTRPRTSSTKTSVAHSHFTEEVEFDLDEEVKVGDKVSFNHPMKAIPGKTMKKVGTVHKVDDDTVHVKVKDKYGVITHKKSASELTKEEFDLGEEVVAEETLSELKKSTLGSYVKKAANSATMSAYGAGGESQRHAGEPVSKRPDTYGADRKVALKRLAGIGKATDRLTKEETEQIAELNKDTVYSYAAKAEKDVDKKHKELISQIKTNNPLSANKTSSKIVKRYAGMDRAETRLNKEETEQGVAEENIVETKGAPKGFHFTKDGKLKRGDADQDGNGGPMLRTDPLDKQRNKIPAVSEGIDFFKVWESIKPEEVVVEEETVDPVALKKEADRIMELNIAARKAK